ncbi:hypothetical protein SH449x_003967 [Pirellulaceae bacterium SH449]
MSSVDQRIRQVAIVMQSLDSSTAKSLLSQLPPDLAKSVKQMMTKLGTVPSRERSLAFESLEGLLGAMMGEEEAELAPAESPASAVLANSRSSVDRVELSSAGSPHSQQHLSHAGDSQQKNEAETPWLSWDPATLATYLANERPAVIATVINQFSPERAKSLLDHLPIQVASSTLVALPHLALSDPTILHDILAEVDRKLPKSQPVLKTVTVAGISKLEAIIAQFGETQRVAWLESIATENQEVAMQLGWMPKQVPKPSTNPNLRIPSMSESSPVPSVAPIPKDGPGTNEMASPLENEQTSLGSPRAPVMGQPSSAEVDIFEETVAIPIERYRTAIVTPTVTDADRISKQIERIRSLALNDLVTLLHSSDRNDVITMLKGADESTRKRAEQIVAPQDLKRFLQLLKGPTPSSDEVLKSVESIVKQLDKLIASGRIAPLATSSIFVAA